MVLVAPSILSGDFAHLADECRRMVDAGADWIHVDIMDGHFVPNLTLGPMVVAALRRALSTVFFDCHLMVEDVEKWAEEFAKAGANSITVHIECFQGDCGGDDKLCLLILRLKSKYPLLKVGVSVKPASSIEQLSDELLGLVDLVLVMTVEPGFGGQKMMEQCLLKCTELRQRRNFKKLVQVDGGVSAENAEKAVEHGADVLVAGTAIFTDKCPKQLIQKFKGLLQDQQGL